MEAEKLLWLAVLKQAINDIRTLARRAKANPSLWDNPLFRNEVTGLRNWLRDQSMEPGGFGFLCEFLDVEPKQAAEGIHRQYLRHLVEPSIGG